MGNNKKTLPSLHRCGASLWTQVVMIACPRPVASPEKTNPSGVGKDILHLVVGLFEIESYWERAGQFYQWVDIGNLNVLQWKPAHPKGTDRKLESVVIKQKE